MVLNTTVVGAVSLRSHIAANRAFDRRDHDGPLARRFVYVILIMRPTFYVLLCGDVNDYMLPSSHLLSVQKHIKHLYLNKNESKCSICSIDKVLAHRAVIFYGLHYKK